MVAEIRMLTTTVAIRRRLSCLLFSFLSFLFIFLFLFFFFFFFHACGNSAFLSETGLLPRTEYAHLIYRLTRLGSDAIA